MKKREERMDPKERSKERKKTVEENRGKVDKKAQAMNMLKARREERKERGQSCVSNQSDFTDSVKGTELI